MRRRRKNSEARMGKLKSLVRMEKVGEDGRETKKGKKENVKERGGTKPG